MRNLFVCADCDKPFGRHEEIALGLIFITKPCEMCGKIIKSNDEWHWLSLVLLIKEFQTLTKNYDELEEKYNSLVKEHSMLDEMYGGCR